MLMSLADHPDAIEPEPFAGPDHPMRMLTRAVADGGEWTPDRAGTVVEVFDRLAPEWHERSVDPTKAAPIADALERGALPLAGSWLELGSGTGAGARVLDGRVGSLVCTDLSLEMLRHAPDLAPRVRSDASRLPFADAMFDALLLVNMILFPFEVDRVLRPGGALLWVNTRGDQTPIHLPAADVLDALPGRWSGTTARAGMGFWLVARRGGG